MNMNAKVLYSRVRTVMYHGVARGKVGETA
jgi:hypothetical protein